MVTVMKTMMKTACTAVNVIIEARRGGGSGGGEESRLKKKVGGGLEGGERNKGKNTHSANKSAA